MQEVKFSPADEHGIVVQLGASIDENTNRRIRRLMERLQGRRGICEMIPTFCSLLILFDAAKTGYARMEKLLRREIAAMGDVQEEKKIVHEIPVCYGGEYGEDYILKNAGRVIILGNTEYPRIADFLKHARAENIRVYTV